MIVFPLQAWKNQTILGGLNIASHAIRRTIKEGAVKKRLEGGNRSRQAEEKS